MMGFLGTLLGSILLIGFGLIVTFYGYGIFRLLLPVMGFVAGMLLGRALVPDSVFWGWVLAIILAVVLAVLSYAYWSAMVTISGAVLGFTFGTALIQMIGFWDWIGVLVGLALAVVFGALYFRYRDAFVMVSTGLSGAALVLYGIGYFIPWFSFLQNQGNWFTFLLTLVLGIFGAIVQLAIFSGMKYYAASAQATPPVVVSRSGTA